MSMMCRFYNFNLQLLPKVTSRAIYQENLPKCENVLHKDIVQFKDDYWIGLSKSGICPSPTYRHGRVNQLMYMNSY